MPGGDLDILAGAKDQEPEGLKPVDLESSQRQAVLPTEICITTTDTGRPPQNPRKARRELGMALFQLSTPTKAVQGHG